MSAYVSGRAAAARLLPALALAVALRTSPARAVECTQNFPGKLSCACTATATLNTSASFARSFTADVQQQVPDITALNLVGCGLQSSVECLTDTGTCSAVKMDILQEATRLETLQLSYNGLTHLPANMLASNSALTSLALDFNELTGLGTALTNLTQLQTLKLEHNRLEVIDDVALAACASLDVVRLSDNAIHTILPNAFAAAVALRTLYLRSNKLALLAPGAFAGLKGLQTLDLASNNLASVGAAVLDPLTSLRELHLGDNRISRIDAGAFDQLRALKTLRIDGNRLTELSGSVFGGVGGTLETLTAKANTIARVDKALGDVLGAVTTLELQHNSITVTEDAAFAGMGALQKLNLSHNFISSLGAKTFAGAKKLKQLDVDHNRVSRVSKRTFAGLDAARHNNAVRQKSLVALGGHAPSTLRCKLGEGIFSPDGIDIRACNCGVGYGAPVYCGTRDIIACPEACAESNDVVIQVRVEAPASEDLDGGGGDGGGGGSDGTAAAVLVLLAVICVALAFVAYRKSKKWNKHRGPDGEGEYEHGDGSESPKRHIPASAVALDMPLEGSARAQKQREAHENLLPHAGSAIRERTPGTPPRYDHDPLPPIGRLPGGRTPVRTGHVKITADSVV